jgi:hypothetical protein
MVCYFSCPVVDAPQLLIMHYDDSSVAGQLTVGFKVAEALLQSKVKGLHCVLRSSRAVAPVSYDGKVFLGRHEAILLDALGRTSGLLLGAKGMAG